MLLSTPEVLVYARFLGTMQLLYLPDAVLVPTSFYVLAYAHTPAYRATRRNIWGSQLLRANRHGSGADGAALLQFEPRPRCRGLEGVLALQSELVIWAAVIAH